MLGLRESARLGDAVSGLGGMGLPEWAQLGDAMSGLFAIGIIVSLVFQYRGLKATQAELEATTKALRAQGEQTQALVESTIAANEAQVRSEYRRACAVAPHFELHHSLPGSQSTLRFDIRNFGSPCHDYEIKTSGGLFGAGGPELPSGAFWGRDTSEQVRISDNSSAGIEIHYRDSFEYRWAQVGRFVAEKGEGTIHWKQRAVPLDDVFSAIADEIRKEHDTTYSQPEKS